MLRCSFAVCCALAGSIFSQAVAGPDYDEGSKDAGATPATARTVTSANGAALSKINGSTATALTGALDGIDLYRIQFDYSRPTFAIGSNPGWDSRLYLFLAYPVTKGVVYVPVMAADDVSTTNPAAVLQGSTGSYPPGYSYYLGIAGPGTQPGTLDAQGNFLPCYQGGLPADWTGTMYPGTGGNYFTTWSGEPTAGGEYETLVVGLNAFYSDDCGYASYLEEGANLIDTTTATTSTLAYPESCSWDGLSGLGKDVWFYFDPETSGTATVSTCDTINFDSTIVIYEVELEGACPTSSAPLACNDDGQECAYYSSTVQFTVDPCHRYFVRVGGYCSSPAPNGTCSTAATGVGTVELTLPQPPGCPTSTDINGDGVVDGADLTLLLTDWGTAGSPH